MAIFNLTVNPEGSVVYNEDEKVALFLVMSAFNPKADTFYSDRSYRTITDAIDALEWWGIGAIHSARYVVSLSKYLATVLGIKLSPVIALTYVALKYDVAVEFVKQDANDFVSVCKAVFNRPDKIANALALAEEMNGKASRLPRFYKTILRNILEGFNAYTLDKSRMRGRKVSLADVVKILRPRVNGGIFKAIIENKPLEDKHDTITTVLSSTKMTLDEKKDWVGENVYNIPVNAFIRNLSNILASPSKAKAVERLRGIVTSKNAFVNPYDILSALVTVRTEYSYPLGEVMGSAYTYDMFKGKRVSILFDVSGSMGYEKLENGKKFLAMLSPSLLKAEYLRAYTFDSRVSRSTSLEESLTRNPVESFDRMKLRSGGSTELVSSIKTVGSLDRPDVFVIITDEVSTQTVFGKSLGFPKSKFIVYNVEPDHRTTIFSVRDNTLKFSALDGKIVTLINLVTNFAEFERQVLNC